MPACNYCGKKGNLKLIEGLCRVCYFPIARKQAELEVYLTFFPVIPDKNGECLFPEQEKDIENMIKTIREFRKEKGLSEKFSVTVQDLFPSMNEDIRAYYKDLSV